jgi:hypothetical protein
MTSPFADLADERAYGVRQYTGNSIGPTAQWQRHVDELDLIRHLFATHWTITEIAQYVGRQRADVVRALAAA